MTMKCSIDLQRALTCVLVAGGTLVAAHSVRAASTLRVLFLGDTGHHRPADRFKQLQPVLARKGIELEYTENLDDLNPAKLAGYDVLAIFANWTHIAPEQER